MQSCFRVLAGAVVFSAIPLLAVRAAAPRTIAFQGVLTNAARVPLPDGTYPSVTFRLYDHLTGPAQLWAETKPVVVAGGHGAFATSLGSSTAIPASVAFDQPYWLSVQVGSDPEMTPRLPLQSVPYALNAWSISGNAGTSPATTFLGTTDNQPLRLKVNGHRALQLQDVVNAAGTVRSVNTLGGYELNSIAPGVVGGTISGGGSAGINDLRGDFGVIGGGNSNFLDAFPYAVIAGGSGNVAQGNYSAIGGGAGNNTQGDNATIAGGSGNFASANSAAVAGGTANQATGGQSFIGGGSGNMASGTYVTVAGGSLNKASGEGAGVASGANNAASGYHSFVGGGHDNVAAGDTSVVAGGSFNFVYSQSAMLGGGYVNQIGIPGVPGGGAETIAGGSGNKATGSFSTIGGGYSNEIGDVSPSTVFRVDSATIGGGGANIARGTSSTIGGGQANRTFGTGATVPGGYGNEAWGNYSFAAGRYAAAIHHGSFVWSDSSSNGEFASQGGNQFCIRAHGGMLLEMGGSAYIYTGMGSAELNRYLLLFNSQGRPSASGLKAGGILCADDFGFANPDKNSLIVKQAVAIGTNSSGGRALYVNGPAGGTTGWNSTSDARLKTNVSTIDSALGIVDTLRGVTFDWRTDTGLRLPEGRQVGFIAQEVEKVLPSVVATDEQGYKSVAYANVVPVLIEAVKEQQKEIEELRARAARVDDLEARLRRLEATSRSAPNGR